MTAKYDTIGTGYNQTRRADPFIVDKLFHYIDPNPANLYLDIGCGTGNYTIALHDRGMRFVGVDPSDKMLEVARSRNSDINWVYGNAEHIPVDSGTVDGVIASLTIHHWSDIPAGFREVHRVLHPGGRFVIFTSAPHQMEGYWLNHYFPIMLRDSIAQMPSLRAVGTALQDAGFEIAATEKYFVKPDLQDLFLYAGKHNPELYLQDEAQRGISSFSSLANRSEVEAGLAHLKDDIQTGKIDEVIESFSNDEGDYLFIVGKT